MAHTATISPFLRSPFTDITGGLISHQTNNNSRCADIEMELLECLEIFGYDRGLDKCKCAIADYKECYTRQKQYTRCVLIRAERDRQIASGQLKGGCKYLNPKIDSY